MEGLERNNGNAAGFLPENREEEISPEKDLEEIEPIEPEKELELELEPMAEIPLEQLEEQGVVDDPVRIYLHEIGRVNLLTADDEKLLAKRMEEGKRIKEIRRAFQQKNNRSPSATEVMLTMLRELGEAAHIIHILQKKAGSKPANKLKESVTNSKLRESIDNEINPQMTLEISS